MKQKNIKCYVIKLLYLWLMLGFFANCEADIVAMGLQNHDILDIFYL